MASHFGEAQCALPGDALSAIAAIGRRLHAATGLRVELHAVIGWRVELQHEDHTLRIPTLREELFDWVFNDGASTVHGFIPEHPDLRGHPASGGPLGRFRSISDQCHTGHQMDLPVGGPYIWQSIQS